MPPEDGSMEGSWRRLPDAAPGSGRGLSLHAPVNVASIWRQIEAVPRPDEDPELPHERAWVPPRLAWLKTPHAIRLRMAAARIMFSAAIAAPAFGRNATVATVAMSLLTLAAVAWPWRLPRARWLAELQARDAQWFWEQALKQWRREGSVEAFQRQLNRLKKLRTQLSNPGREHERRRAELPERSRHRQLWEFLRQFAIGDADIPEIKAGRKADLSARGIVTAAEVERDRVRSTPGFGPEAVTKMLLWRQSKELGFRFDPDRPPAPRDVQAIEDEFQAWLKDSSDEFARGPALLRYTTQEIAHNRGRLLAELEQLWHRYQMARLTCGTDDDWRSGAKGGPRFWR
jgi:hypothetical protein